MAKIREAALVAPEMCDPGDGSGGGTSAPEPPSESDVECPVVGTLLFYTENGGTAFPGIVVGITGGRPDIGVFGNQYKGYYVVPCVSEGPMSEPFTWSVMR